MKKKILTIISLILVLITLFACSGENYSFKALPGGPSISDPIIGGNSGVCVQKGEYIYFINGAVSDDEDNKFGTPAKGAIYRCKVDANGNIEEGTTVVMAPKIFYSRNVGDGLYIPDSSDKLYYVSPSVTKDKQGNTLFYQSDIFSVNLDGTKTKKFGTVDYFYAYKFLNINSTMYFVYTTEGVDDDGNPIIKTMALSENGKKFEVTEEHEKALIGDNNYVYYTKIEKKPDGNEITGNENFNKVYRKAIINGTEEELKLSSGENISQDKFSVDLVEFKDGALYYTKNVFVGASTSTLYFAYNTTNKKEYQLNFSSYNNPYFLGFNDSGEYKGTLFYTESRIVLLKGREVGKTTPIGSYKEITYLTAEPQYLFMEEGVLYFMSSGKMYSVNVGNEELNVKTDLTDFKITLDLERYYPKKMGKYIYFIGIAEEEYYSKYLYCHDITKVEFEEDYSPLRLGVLSKADDDLRIEAEEEEIN